jgi:hypothetical protein
MAMCSLQDLGYFCLGSARRSPRPENFVSQLWILLGEGQEAAGVEQTAISRIHKAQLAEPQLSRFCIQNGRGIEMIVLYNIIMHRLALWQLSG